MVIFYAIVFVELLILGLINIYFYKKYFGILKNYQKPINATLLAAVLFITTFFIILAYYLSWFDFNETDLIEVLSIQIIKILISNTLFLSIILFLINVIILLIKKPKDLISEQIKENIKSSILLIFFMLMSQLIISSSYSPGIM